ncbi:MAG: hypothetical protein COB58_01705 [Thalassobium sp.]|nr:MAG: hypothetical protein COB43_01275 [Oceanospirillales bacterium]PHQ88024.1 MAG: hypothetical protein COB58_01705 [Thalassobium sp.]
MVVLLYLLKEPASISDAIRAPPDFVIGVNGAIFRFFRNFFKENTRKPDGRLTLANRHTQPVVF